MNQFDENAACKYIAARLAEAGRPVYNADELLNIIDMIWDFYDTRGLLDPDSDDDDPERAELEQEIVAYAKTLLKRDKGAGVDFADLPLIVKAELDYEDTLLEGDEGINDLDDLI